MRITKRYTEYQLKEAVANSTSYRQVLEKLNVIPAGGNYQVLKNSIKRFQLDVSHFTGKASNKNKVLGPKRPIQDYLSNLYPIQSFKLHQRLIKEGIFQEECSSCHLTQWLNQKIPLELEHKDGNNQNNNLDNLCFLCPNCHAFTSTYRGRNKKSTKLGSALP